MEAVKQLGSLASKMNECKRRKELSTVLFYVFSIFNFCCLVRKYREDQQLSLAERLSRINVHSFVKKSNRLKYRISSTMGFNTVIDVFKIFLYCFIFKFKRLSLLFVTYQKCLIIIFASTSFCRFGTASLTT